MSMVEHDVPKLRASSIGCVAPWDERDELRRRKPDNDEFIKKSEIHDY